jgi:branched-chain amino acid transport system permease protein
MRASPRTLATVAVLLALAAVPPLAAALGQPFYLDLVRRIMIFAIAAVSLNLILGYGGMVSFGHAAYLGVAPTRGSSPRTEERLLQSRSRSPRRLRSR